MSDEGFLKRWSRKKRAETPPPAADSESEETPPSNLSPQAGEGSPSPPPRSGGGREGATPAEEEEAIDPATLPPIESLGPDSDYTVFLKKGVPDALRIAALRKAWVSDPFIRDFRGPAEYAIDYTTSDFDLRPTDDVAKMLDRIFPPAPAHAEAPPGPAAPPQAPSASERPIASSENAALPQEQAEATVAKAERSETSPAVPQPALPPRKHGGALPD